MSVIDTKPETAKLEAQADRDPAAAVKTQPVDNKISTNNAVPKQNVESPSAPVNTEAAPNSGQTAKRVGVVNTNQSAAQAGAPGKIGQTREQIKKEREQENADTAQQGEQQQSLKHMRIRLIPIWLRILIIFLLLVASLVVGTMVGYGVIGGGNPWEVLKQSTWTHIVDLINKE